MDPILKVCFLNTAVLIEVLGNGPKVTTSISVGSLHKFARCSTQHPSSFPWSSQQKDETWGMDWNQSVGRHCERWSTTLWCVLWCYHPSSRHVSDLTIYSICDWISFFTRKKALCHTLGTIPHFLISLVVPSVTTNRIYGRINFTYGKIFWVWGILQNSYNKDWYSFHVKISNLGICLLGTPLCYIVHSYVSL
jgi:hypothetical protein